LEFVDSFETDLEVNICPGDSYVFYGEEIRDPGVYTHTLQAEIGGCDSVIVLHLGFLPLATTPVSAVQCVGTTYDFYGQVLTEAGTYEAVFTGSNGCDSTVVLKLDFVEFFEVELEATICAGDTYDFDGEILSEEGVYVKEYTAEGGCDSTVTLTLTVLPTSAGTDEATICFGDVFDYNGELLTEAGEYTFVLKAENGCDSTVVFTLNIRPAIQTDIEATICAGDTYDFNGETLFESGTYEAILTAENGCDSLVVLDLTVLSLGESELEVNICDGESYEYNGETLTEEGIYFFTLTGENGCDSLVSLALYVRPAYNSFENVRICEGDAYLFDGSLITEAGTYVATFLSEYGCDSTVTLVLEVSPLQNTAIEATICDNGSYDFNGEELTEEGVYTAVLTDENGCDSTVVLTLTVLPTKSTTITASICEGETYNFFGLSLSETGDYEFGFEAENGCDSTVTVRLTVRPIQRTNIEATICEGEIYDYEGNELTETGDYEYVYDGPNGCDSIVTVRLTVLPLQSSILYVAQCVGTSYTFNGEVLTESGTYSVLLTGPNGCDSTATLVLEFVESFETNIEATICAGDSFEFGGEELTVGGEYQLTLTAEGGCDSIIYLNLIILEPTSSTTEATICAGETFDFNGLSLTESGVYEVTLVGENGCDSVAVLNLTILPTSGSALEATICDNEIYLFNGLALTEAGVYTSVLTGENGCDSTVVLTLNVLPTLSTAIEATICSNEAYNFNGQLIFDPGTYTAKYTGENGCDSTVTLVLSVLPTASSSLAASSCDGTPFVYNGITLTQSGQYSFVYGGAAANGCDSTETLFLTIFPPIPPTNIAAAICQGESYDFYGNSLTVSGTYTAALASSVGCDSLIVLTLTVNPNVQTNISASICAGESYPFVGQLLTQPGTYTASLQTAAGCDSIVVLTLTVNTVNTEVTVQGNTATASATGATYQWISCANNQPIIGATGPSYTPNISGQYAVIVTQNGCTDTSTCVVIIGVSTTEPLADQAWSLQPNPASSLTRIVFAEATETELWLEINDLSGRLLHSQNVGAGSYQVDIDLNNMPSGMLIVRLSNANGVSA
jgi:uncharacterized protein YegP (UPF0339 family)